MRCNRDARVSRPISKRLVRVKDASRLQRQPRIRPPASSADTRISRGGSQSNRSVHYPILLDCLSRS